MTDKDNVSSHTTSRKAEGQNNNTKLGAFEVFTYLEHLLVNSLFSSHKQIHLLNLGEHHHGAAATSS